MPITTSAKKALRQSIRRREKNAARMSLLKKTIKDFQKMAAAKKIADPKAAFAKVQKAIDKTAKVGLIKKNTAARKKSRLASALSRALA